MEKKITLESVYNQHEYGVIAEYGNKFADAVFQDEEAAETTHHIGWIMLNSEFNDHVIENFFTKNDEGIVIVRLGGNVVEDPKSIHARYERKEDSEIAADFLYTLNNWIAECVED